MAAHGRDGSASLPGGHEAHDLAVVLAATHVAPLLLVECDRHIVMGNEFAPDIDDACASLATLRRNAASRARVSRAAPSASMLHSITRRTS